MVPTAPLAILAMGPLGILTHVADAREVANATPLVSVGTLLAVIAASVLGTGLVAAVGRARYYDVDDGVLGPIRHVLSVLGSLFGATLVQGAAYGILTVVTVFLAVTFPIALLIVGLLALYIGIRLSLLVPAIVVEGCGPTKGIAFTWSGTKGRSLRVLALLLISAVGVLAILAGIDATSTAAVTGRVAGTAVLSAVVGLALTRFWIGARQDYVVDDQAS